MVRAVALSEAVEFDPSDPGFLADPYPVLNRVREQAPLFYDAERERWFVTRHEDVRSCLRGTRGFGQHARKRGLTFAPLARIELEASLEALRRSWPDFRLGEEPRRSGAFVIWGLEALRLARD
jgi:cytochrome P450